MAWPWPGSTINMACSVSTESFLQAFPVPRQRILSSLQSNTSLPLLHFHASPPPLIMARSHSMLRMVILGNHFMVFLSSVIVMGLAAYFISRDFHRGTHIVFQVVVVSRDGPGVAGETD